MEVDVRVRSIYSLMLKPIFLVDPSTEWDSTCVAMWKDVVAATMIDNLLKAAKNTGAGVNQKDTVKEIVAWLRNEGTIK